VTDEDALALNAFQEANLEPDDGMAAVCRVVMNRTAQKYESDGTIQGTIFAHNQFSWTSWSMVAGRYTQVAVGSGQVATRAGHLLALAQSYLSAWARAKRISGAVQSMMYAGPEYAAITDDTLLYVNLAISSPAWATPDKLVTKIGHHSFYRN
jgi:spore germination cell wall hydrolase CwlJ-like protein